MTGQSGSEPPGNQPPDNETPGKEEAACGANVAGTNGSRAMTSLNAVATINSAAWRGWANALNPHHRSPRNPQPATNQRVRFKRGTP